MLSAKSGILFGANYYEGGKWSAGSDQLKLFKRKKRGKIHSSTQIIQKHKKTNTKKGKIHSLTQLKARSESYNGGPMTKL